MGDRKYSFDSYQSDATKTAIYPGQGGLMGLMYAALGTAGEAGETAEQVKKTFRDDGVSVETFATHQVSPERREAILKEVGDTLWYIAQVCTELRADMSDVAEGNISKLRARQAQNQIHGEGSDREVGVGASFVSEHAPKPENVYTCRRGTKFTYSSGGCGCCHG